MCYRWWVKAVAGGLGKGRSLGLGRWGLALKGSDTRGRQQWPGGHAPDLGTVERGASLEEVRI